MKRTLFATIALALLLNAPAWGATIFTESMGNSGGTVTLAVHEANNGFDNDSYTMTQGGATNPADIRITSASTGYTGASGNSNVWFTSTNAAYGFAIEGIDASAYTSLTVQFGYRKESASALPTFALDYWDGTQYVNVPFTFNEAANATAGWYLSPVINLPTGAQISGLRLRWVKSGTVAVRIDDVILSGTAGATTPTVTTATITSITSSTASGGGNVTADGGASVTNRGVCWSTSINPTIANDTTDNGTGTGSFASSITGLSASTLYHVRAYATNSQGTSYGGDSTFITGALGGGPTIFITGSLTAFGNQVISTSSGSQSYVVHGTELIEDIVINAPAHFQVSLNDVNFYSSRTLAIQVDSVPHTTIYARFSPSSTGPKSGNITHTSSGATQQDLAVSGNGIQTEPGTQASAVGFTLVGADTMTVGWTRGTGDSVIVLIRNGGAVDANPADGSDYTANAAFGSGSQVGAGNYVIYKGTGTSVKATSLSPNNAYYVAVYEFNSDGPASANYLMTPATGNQTTLPAPYVWNQTGSADWTVAANWTPTRTTPSASDVLHFKGGGAVTATSVPAQTIAQLQVSNNTALTLTAGGINTLTIGGDAGTDFEVTAGSKLTVSGSNVLTISLSTGATGSISDSMIFTGGAHKLTADDASGVTFNSGGVFVAATGFTSNAFGTTNLNSVVFAAGSSYICRAGSNPFGASAPNSVIVLQTGSIYKQEVNSGAAFSGRTYSHFEYNYNGVLSGTGSSALSMDNVSVTQGTLNLGMTGAFNLKGSVSAASGATLNFNPASAATVTFNGTGQQTVSGSGTLTLQTNQSVALNNSGGLVMQRDLTVNGGLTTADDTLFIGANTLTLNGGLTMGGDLLLGGPSSSLAFGGTGTDTLSRIELYDFTLDRGAGDSVVATGGDWVVHNNMTLTSGVLAPLNSSAVTIYNPIAGTADNFKPDSLLNLYIEGTAAGITIPASCDSLNILYVNNPNGVTLAGDLYVSLGGALTLADGGISAGSNTLSYPAAPEFASLNYYGTAVQTTTSIEWPDVNGPQNVEINNPAGVALHADRTIKVYGLSLTSGAFSTGSNVITLDTPATCSSSGGWVDGNLRLFAPAGGDRGSVTLGYECGANDAYSPLFVAFDSVTASGYLTCKANYASGGYVNASDPLSASKRYWTLTKGGGLDFDTCAVTLYYVDDDFNTNFTLAAEDTMKCGCRYDDGTKKTWWDFFPLTRYVDDNYVTLAQVTAPRLVATAAGSDFLFGAGYQVLAGISWIGVADESRPSQPALPKVFSLARPYPNPASGRAVLSLSLPDARPVRLEIYNMLGQKVALAADRQVPAGIHQLAWDLRGADRKKVSGGVYFYRLTAGNNTVTGRLAVLR